MTVTCRLLGPVALSVDGDPPPTELLWRKHLALFVYLACSPDHRRGREHLIGLLWGDKDGAAARHSLREAVRVLRKAVGDSGVETPADQVRLRPGTVTLDIADFEKHAHAGRWEEALALVAGEWMEGFGVPDASEFEDWLAAERGRWRLRIQEARLRAGELRLARGDPGGAVILAEQALRDDPGAAPAVRLLMRARALQGDHAGALTVYDQAVARWERAQHARPGPDLVALAERLRQGRGWHVVAPPAGGTTTDPGRRPPLVGSGDVLSAMYEAWERTREQGTARVSVLRGLPGFGKTRLSEELRRRILLAGGAVLHTRSIAADREIPCAALVAAMRDGAQSIPGVAAARPEALAAFAARIAEWEDRFGPSLRQVTAMPLGAAFAEILRAATAEGPLTLVFDDADWLDDRSLGAIEGAVRDLATTPLLVVLTWSGVPHGAAIDGIRARIGRDIPGASFTLGPFDRTALATLGRAILPRFTDAELARVVRRVEADSAGIPLLAVELFSAIAEGLAVDGAPGAWPQSHKTLDQTLPGELPDLLIGAIRVGFRVLSRPAQAALAAAAVLDERVDRHRIGRAAGLEATALDDALDELEWRQWLVAEPRGYAFVARIVREVVRRDLVTTGQRQRILEAAAR